MVVLLALLSVAAAPAERAPGAPAYVAPAHVAPAAEPAVAVADTLRYTARAGQPFIAALPARLGGAEVTYEPLDAPALSWLVDRSFFWNVQAGESGTLPIVFERRTAAGDRDTLVLLVDLTR